MILGCNIIIQYILMSMYKQSSCGHHLIGSLSVPASWYHRNPFQIRACKKTAAGLSFIQPINSICLQSTANQWTGARTFDQESVQLISSLISYIIIQAYSLCKLSTKHWLYNSDQIVPTTSTINRFRTSSIQAWRPGCLNDIEVCFNTESSVSQASGCQVDHQHVAQRTACWNIIYPIGKWLDDAWLHDIHDMCAMLLKMYHVAIIAVVPCPFSAGKVTVIDNWDGPSQVPFSSIRGFSACFDSCALSTAKKQCHRKTYQFVRCCLLINMQDFNSSAQLETRPYPEVECPKFARTTHPNNTVIWQRMTSSSWDLTLPSRIFPTNLPSSEGSVFFNDRPSLDVP